MPVIGNMEYIISAKNSTKAGIDSAERDMHKFGDRISAWTIAKGQVIGDFCKKLISTTATVFTQTFKSAIGAYKEFEQLEGGVELLYGTASKTVMQFAKDAYKYGIDANRYMRSTTSYAAALVNSLGGDQAKAAEVANMAVEDMADNAAAFGTDVASIENAYMGFAKGNYTMLDNLKLGFGGTRQEMERLLKEAGKLTGKTYNINKLEDVFEAIHIIQKERLHITGHAAEEAEKTVEGSINKMKASWQNLLIAMGSGKDVKKATKEFTDSFKKAVKNLLPVAKEVLSNLFVAIGELMPEIGNFISELFSELKKNLPQPNILTFLETAFNGLSGIIDLVTQLIENFPETVKKLEQSDSPVLRGLGGTLDFIKQAFDWIEKHKEFVVGALEAIAGAFALITIDKAVMSFLNLFTANSALGKFLGFGNGLSNNGNGGGGGLLLPLLKKALPIAAFAGVTLQNAITPQGNDDIFDKDGNLTQGLKYDSEGRVVDPDGRVVWAPEGTDTRSAAQRWNDSKTYSSERNDGIEVAGEWEAQKAHGLAWVRLTEQQMRATEAMYDANRAIIEQTIDDAEYERVMAEYEKAFEGQDALFEKVEDLMETVMQSKENMADLPSDLPDDAFRVFVTPELADDSKTVIQNALDSLGFTVNVDPRVGSYIKGMFSHAKGEWDVPYDNYPALLHRDEMVLNKSQARRYRDGSDVDYATIGQMVGDAVNAAMSKVYIMMSGDKVGDITTKRIKNNLNALNYAKLRAMGG